MAKEIIETKKKEIVQPADDQKAMPFGKNVALWELICAEKAYLPFKMLLYSLSLPSTSKAFWTPGSVEVIT